MWTKNVVGKKETDIKKTFIKHKIEQTCKFPELRNICTFKVLKHIGLNWWENTYYPQTYI